jgi:hypothetical protein
VGGARFAVAGRGPQELDVHTMTPAGSHTLPLPHGVPSAAAWVMHWSLPESAPVQSPGPRHAASLRLHAVFAGLIATPPVAGLQTPHAPTTTGLVVCEHTPFTPHVLTPLHALPSSLQSNRRGMDGCRGGAG